MACDLALIGFGEAGSTFAGAASWGSRVRAYDISPVRAYAIKEHGIVAAASAAGALAGTPLVLSLVTASQAFDAAQTCAPLLAPGAIWCDCNSVAPDTKRAAAQAIEAAGGRYVDVAMLAPVRPARLTVPLLLAGKASDAACTALKTLGFRNVRIVGEDIGRASAIKMVRSVMVKGIEALTDEMMEAARKAGIEDEVLASLDASEQHLPWGDKAEYNLERMIAHGTRRAAEMEEVAKMLLSLGVAPVMTRGTVCRQREAGGKGTRA